MTHDSRVVEKRPAPLAPDGFIPTANVGFIDFETLGALSLKESGVARYAASATALMLTYALGEGPLEIAVASPFRRPLARSDLPDAFWDFHERVRAGEAVWAAFNSGFDRQIWNQATTDFPLLEPFHIIDVAVQTGAAGLPPTLEGVGQKLFRRGKSPDGKLLIRLFTLPESTATPETHPQAWQDFCDYALRDTELMREAYTATRALPLEEWQEYWLSERINDRGAPVDLALCQAADRISQEALRRAGEELALLTDGLIDKVTQDDRMKKWLFKHLDEEGRELLTIKPEKRDEDDEVVREAKFGLDRQQVQILMAYLEALEDRSEIEDRALRILEIREYGASTTPAKFGRIAAMQVDGALKHQYVFSGAPQTGRYSSRGAQVHNLNRKALEYETDAIDALVNGCSYEEFASLGDTQTPVTRKLSLLIRPTFVAPAGKVFVWSDFSNIEARVLPWLANSEGGEERLDLFRAVDADPTIPDLYTRTAAELSNVRIDQVTEAIRQRGKVTELAAGFGGGANSLLSMAASYGMHISVEDAVQQIEHWRVSNRWAVEFWGKHTSQESFGLWGAVNEARMRPMVPHGVGRLTYMYDPSSLGGTLYAALPSGRLLSYANLKVDKVAVKDDDGNIVEYRKELRYLRRWGRSKIWHGSVCENVVQAAAADLLRGVITRIEGDRGLDWMPIVLHTHDEILCLVDENKAEACAAVLRREMQRDFPWTDGLPLMSAESIAYQYSKSKSSLFTRRKL